ncbi:hypothetical protein RDWZM_005550 [Blomia tropicalis]|uniref:RecA family profile 1 domain-containing protein n=1 Tax=Blomia tropicalis TaxID=40697 RepID=A0A9Q0M478_BLOTA|nr:hypothetical protein RDWZM_005550 [Blomia tropicalis]
MSIPWDGVQSDYIRIGCKGLDFAFGFNGLPTGKLVQITGEAGTGKSQICMQLCFCIQLDFECGGLEAEALYIDAENSFRPDRIREIAFNYFHSIEPNLLKFKIEEILDRIHVRRINTNVDDLCDVILNGELETFFEFHSNVRLLILDSIAYHFRYDYQYDNNRRIQQLVQISFKLRQIAHERNIAVLITNQVKFSSCPALGDIWNSIFSTSLLLNRDVINSDNNIVNENVSKKIKSEKCLQESTSLSKRLCSILKSSTINCSYKCYYCITKNGVEDS